MDANEPSGPRELDELVAHALDVLESEGEPGLARICSAHPEHAAAIRERVELLGAVGLLETLDVRPPERLGEFRLGEQLGLGGMGIVYRAVQERLGREVALKVIRPEHLYFPGARTRFRREVEIVARLQHPGIVPIYTVGEENGVPYFAMELLQGRTLAQAIERLRGRDPSTLEGGDLAADRERPGYLFEGSWEEACLRVIRQVADALDHAHQRGVVHRDLKPSNVLVTEGATSRAVLLDFGLAAASGSGKITRSGAKLGSASYMAPEQVRGEGDAIGPRTDVYSLGVTLYELLTLKPAFSAPTETEVLLQIERGVQRPPRALEPWISWEAETVCLTAMELDPARRYASAADLARDLDNVLAKRPIEARRVGAARKLRRWVERNPATAAAVALATALVVGGPTVYAWQERRSSRAIAEQRDRAERNFGRALEAVDRMLSRVGSVDLRFQPRMEPVRTAVLEDAVALLQEFVADAPDDPRAAREVADAQAKLGELHGDLGRNVEGAGAYASAASGYERLRAGLDGESEESRGLLLASLVAHVEEATLWMSAGRAAESSAVLDRADARLAEVPAELRGRPELLRVALRIELARDVTSLAVTGPAGPVDRIRESARKSDELLARDPSDASRSLALMCWDHFGVRLLDQTPQGKRNEEAIAALERAVELARESLAEAPDEPGHVQSLAETLSNLGGAMRRAGDEQRTIDRYDEARDLLEQLVGEFPGTLAYKSTLATVTNQLGLVHDYRGEFPEAESLYRRAAELLRELTAAAPEDALLCNRYGQAQANLATPVGKQGDLPGAMELVRGAIATQERALELAPGHAEIRADVSMHWMMLGTMLREHGDLRAAADAFDSSAAANPTSVKSWQGASRALARLVPAAREAPDLADDVREAWVEDFAARSVAAVRGAISAGASKPPDIRKFKDYAVLHGTKAFESFADELASAP